MQYSGALRDAADPNNPALARGLLYVLAALSAPLAGAEELLRDVINTVTNMGIGGGEHLGRAYLYAGQGEHAEAAAEVLTSVASEATAFDSAAGLAEPYRAFAPTTPPNLHLPSDFLADELPSLKLELPNSLPDSIEVAPGAPKPYEAPNTFRVDPIRPGESRLNYGTRAHQELERGISETNPAAQGRFNTAPGLRGPDFDPASGFNAEYGEMKSIRGRQSPMLRQGRNWGFDPQSGRYYFYDAETGTVFEGIIQTDKFASGLFR
jgi:hypothetical protein